MDASGARRKSVFQSVQVNFDENGEPIVTPAHSGLGAYLISDSQNKPPVGQEGGSRNSFDMN